MNSRPDFLSFTHTSTSSSSQPTSSLPAALSLLVTDTLDAPASFVLVQLVAHALRPAASAAAAPGGGSGAAGKRRVVVLGVRERDEYWTAVLKKNGIQIPTERSTGHFTFIDSSDPSLALPDLFTAVAAALVAPSQSAPPAISPAGTGDALGPLVVIDDHSASLVTLLHADSLSPSPTLSLASTVAFDSPEDQYLFRQVLQRCDLWAQVDGFGNGGSGARGESRAFDYWTVDAPRMGARAWQFRLDEAKGALWNVKGGGGGAGGEVLVR
ncbi:hypothetical protein Rhopal_004236-T1 [Rhodotorula paludigena]|uniref:Uncharacterized protein n=1 Tax=Rhodotorula paludigena TaxID=86838 RepID=A0AAV5GLX9_9BASI|nr:hypothetical protein Rhopal_004236-T1 [Rhodotorula paludigena]